MGEKRPSASLPLFVFGLMLIVVMMCYAAGYFWLGDQRHLSLSGAAANAPTVVRVFKSQWMATVYRPAAAMESRLLGKAVVTAFVHEKNP